jgi:hypothetical protein
VKSFRLQIALSAALAIATFAPELKAASCAAHALSSVPMPPGYAGACAAELASPPPSPMQARLPQDIGYAVDVLGSANRPANRIYSFALDNFADQVFDNSTQPGVIATDYSADGQQLIGVLAENAPQFPGSLGYLVSGGFFRIGAISGLPPFENLNGLATNPRTGAAYLSTSGGSPQHARLWSINMSTAAATLIGEMSAPTDVTGTVMIAIAMNCEGKLYAHNIGDKALYQVDPVTAATTLVGSHGLDSNFAQGMDFDNSDGTLYGFMMLNSGQNRFGFFNLTTGSFTTLTNDTPVGEFEGAIPTLCPAVVSLFADGFEG